MKFLIIFFDGVKTALKIKIVKSGGREEGWGQVRFT